MQRRSGFLIMWSVVMLVAFGAVPRVSAQSNTVRCESRGAEREQCAIERGARVEIARQLSSNPCHQNSTWGVGSGYIWVSGGCRADFAVSAISSAYPTGPGNANATPMQLRACRSEADRRMPGYSYEQVEVEPYHREGSTSWVHWQAGNEGGMCTVASNGRIIDFTNDAYGGGAGATRITCESRSTGRQECPLPSGAQIRLVRQLSQNPCRLNDTYGRGAGYVWVAEGCRGEFEVSRPGVGPGGTTQVSCESVRGDRRVCPIPSGARARLARQLSDAPCILDRTYGFDARSIWVSGGCRGEFDVTRGGYPGEAGGNVTRLTCSSSGAARQECAVSGASRVRLVRQISSSPCTLNQSYGIGVGHIWVSNGCRGEFDVTVGGPGDGTGLPGLPGTAERVTCESQGGERTECRIRTGGAVQLVRQLSTSPCARNSTWGAGYGVIWVTRGCRGEFEVR